MLVWYEHYGDINEAIAREKQLKKWERRWKLELVEGFNPDWRDLYETLNNGWCGREIGNASGRSLGARVRGHDTGGGMASGSKFAKLRRDLGSAGSWWLSGCPRSRA